MAILKFRLYLSGIAIYNFLNKPSENIDMNDLMNDCLNSWIESCKKDYEYQYSDEAIKEHLEINEYEFDKDGYKL